MQNLRLLLSDKEQEGLDVPTPPETSPQNGENRCKLLHTIWKRYNSGHGQGGTVIPGRQVKKWDEPFNCPAYYMERSNPCRNQRSPWVEGMKLEVEGDQDWRTQETYRGSPKYPGEYRRWGTTQAGREPPARIIDNKTCLVLGEECLAHWAEWTPGRQGTELSVRSVCASVMQRTEHALV